ncbi:hypothetical protein ACIQXF_13440 [Lysinibacillus sp. NPDC097231]|uniref:hypothetical protein n=1 Tax=Lysinibacillus sp. NPDC097231 TaxID=3364142 RepID=UPI003823CE67
MKPVECENIEHPWYKVKDEMNKFEELTGELLACGTCLKSRLLDKTTSCPISTMDDLLKLSNG